MERNNKKKTIFIIVVATILILIGVVIILRTNKKTNNTNIIDGNEQLSYLDGQDGIKDTYLKMAKEIWKQEVVLLEAIKNGEIEVLVENMGDSEYLIKNFIEIPNPEFIDAASEYLKFMYADLTWSEPDEETYEMWAMDLENEINEKSKDEGLSDDWIHLSTGDLIKGKNFIDIYSTYAEVYPDASHEWNNETTEEAYEKLRATLDQIPTDSLYLNIDIKFDENGEFVLAYDSSLLNDTEIEIMRTSYWLKDRYGDDSWVGHFIMEDVLD